MRLDVRSASALGDQDSLEGRGSGRRLLVTAALTEVVDLMHFALTEDVELKITGVRDLRPSIITGGVRYEMHR